jgi:uncharacterized protein (UPF0335 family)
MIDQVARDALRSFVERIEHVEEEKQALSDDLKQIYAEAKSSGFDTKTIRRVIRVRKQEQADRERESYMLDLYLHALGMRLDAPLASAELEASLKKEVEKPTRARKRKSDADNVVPFR